MKKWIASLLCLSLALCPFAAAAAPAAGAPLLDGATLVTFGDSITALSTWPRSVATELNMTLVNSGIGGNNTNHAAARFERDVAAHDPDFVIMCFGTNDFNREASKGTKPQVDVATYKANLASFVDKVTALGATPILMTPPFIAEFVFGGGFSYPEGSVNGAVDTYVKAMREVATAKNVDLIDIHSVCDNGGYKTDTFLVSDGVHLSSVGNTVYTNTICDYMKNRFRQDPTAPRVPLPTAPSLETGTWTKSLVPDSLADWLIIYPDTTVGFDNADGSVSFANTNNMWPEVHYNLALENSIRIPVKGSYLTMDIDLEAGSNIRLFFNGPTPTLAYENTYVSLTDAMTKALPTLQASNGDLAGGQSIQCTIPFEDIVPASFIAADGTVLYTGMKVYVIGDAGKKVTIHKMSVSTADPNPAPSAPVYKDTQNLLPANNTSISANQGVADHKINTDGSLTIARNASSNIAWPSIKVNCGKQINLADTPYLHLQMDTVGGYANGHLCFTTSMGTQVAVQLSQLVNGDVNDFTTDLDTYVDLSAYLGTTRTVTLDYYTLSVYGDAGAALTWNTISAARNSANDPVVKGDMDGDGELSTTDARSILRAIADSLHFTASQVALLDVNNDGNVNTSDVREILKTIASNN